MTSKKSLLTRVLTSLPVAFAALVALPAVAHAQGQAEAGSSNCPPGSWFCGDAQAHGNATGAAGAGAGAGAQGAAGGGGALQPLPGAEGNGAAPPPVVVYQPAPPPIVVVQGRTEGPAPYRYSPRPPERRRSEWGINLRGEGAFIGSGKADNSGMGGVGLGLRYRPVPVAAIEGDLDFFGGNDYNGDKRGESSFTLNCLIFVNPRSKVQFYFLGGFGWQGAKVTKDGTFSSNGGSSTSSASYDQTYSYFGMQGGVGLEFRLAKHFALNLALVGFVRGRTDSDANYRPEFTDATGRTTNTSGGGLLQGGMTFYF